MIDDTDEQADLASADVPDEVRRLEEYWYAAAPSVRLKDKPLATNILGRDIALFRDAFGVAHALLDRCCHRGVRLSLGSVTDGTLACRYHGWRYNGVGQCVHVPSLPEGSTIKSGFATPAFPCAEQDGYVWVRVGGHGGELPPVPRIEGFDAHRWTQGTMPFACSWMAAVENNLDWCHAAFAHPWSHPHYFDARLRGLRSKPYEIRLTDSGMMLFSPVTADAAVPVPRRALRIYFDLPDRIRFYPWGETPLIVLHFVPTGPSSCRLEWLGRRLVPAGPKVSWTAKEARVFAEDRTMLESAQGWYGRHGGAFERSVEADASTLLARRIVALARAGVWRSGRARLPHCRIVQARA